MGGAPHHKSYVVICTIVKKMVFTFAKMKHIILTTPRDWDNKDSFFSLFRATKPSYLKSFFPLLALFTTEEVPLSYIIGGVGVVIILIVYFRKHIIPILNYPSIKKLITYYLSFILFIRSFFLVERPLFIPIIVGILAILGFYHVIPGYTPFELSFFTLLWLGVYLISLDNIGSYISSLIIEKVPGITDQVLSFLLDGSQNSIIAYYKAVSLTALIFGKTAMTSTGRAAVGAAFITGAFFYANAYAERKHTRTEAEKQRDFNAAEAKKQQDFNVAAAKKQRDFNATEAQKQRDFLAGEAAKQRSWEQYKLAKESYDKKWFPGGKPPTPPKNE